MSTTTSPNSPPTVGPHCCPGDCLATGHHRTMTALGCCRPFRDECNSLRLPCAGVGADAGGSCCGSCRWPSRGGIATYPLAPRQWRLTIRSSWFQAPAAGWWSRLLRCKHPVVQCCWRSAWTQRNGGGGARGCRCLSRCLWFPGQPDDLLTSAG